MFFNRKATNWEGGRLDPLEVQRSSERAKLFSERKGFSSGTTRRCFDLSPGGWEALETVGKVSRGVEGWERWLSDAWGSKTEPSPHWPVASY